MNYKLLGLTFFGVYFVFSSRVVFSLGWFVLFGNIGYFQLLKMNSTQTHQCSVCVINRMYVSRYRYTHTQVNSLC